MDTMPNYASAYWEDYFGQDPTPFHRLSYLNRDGVRKFVSIEQDIEAQIAELKRTVGGNIEFRLYKEPAV